MANYRSDRPADRVKEQVTARAAVERYGYAPNRAGYVPCPFHREKTASLKLYEGSGGWHCFGCNRGGSVIDFVMELFGLTFPQAVLRLNEDFRLGLTRERPAPGRASAIAAERRSEARALEAYRREYASRTVLYEALWEAKKAGPDHPLFPHACREMDGMDYWFESHPWR